MISGYDELLSASSYDRRDLFIAASRRLGTAEQNVEKDFWVCWTLDVLFNRLPSGGPRLLFKGGTSLSKAFGLISRFSEDIDVTVFRHDLGEDASVEALEGLSGKKRKARLDAIKAACQAFIAGPLRSQIIDVFDATLNHAKIIVDGPRVELDAGDADCQTLLLWYPCVTATKGDGYVRPAVKIESGAKSALDPNHPVVIRPYLADDVANLNRSRTLPRSMQRELFGTRSSFSMGCEGGSTDAASYAAVASAYPAITTTSIVSWARPLASKHSRIRHSDKTASNTRGCFSIARTLILRAPNRVASP